MIIKKCKYCGKEFKVFPYNKNRKFCSKECYWKYASLFPYPTTFQKGHKGFGTPESYTKQAIKMKIIMKGKYKGERHSPATEFKKGIHNNVGKNNPMYGIRGSKNPKWTGNSPLSLSIRKSPEYNEWRSIIFDKDNYACQVCYTKNVKGKRVYLYAHHLISFLTIIKKNKISTLQNAINCKELWNTENGVVLCRKCHYSFHKIYGFKNNTKAQFLEFKFRFLLISFLTNLIATPSL